MRPYRFMLFISVAIVVTMLFGTSLASADSVGQCNMRSGNEMHSVPQWISSLESEGVLGQAARMNFSEAGYNSVDGQSPRKWVEGRVVLISAASSYTGMDYSCNGGTLSEWKVTTNPVGTKTFATLPPQYNKHNSSTHRTKKLNHRIKVKRHVVGFAPCANTHAGEVWYYLWVESKPHHHKPHMPPPHHEEPKHETPQPPPPPSMNCSNYVPGSNNTTGGNCNNECSNVNSPGAGGNCNKECVGVNVCNKEVEKEKPSPKCEPPKKGTYPNCKSLPKITLEKIQEFYPNEQAYVYAEVEGENITSVRCKGEYGANIGEAVELTPNLWQQYYKAPSEVGNEKITCVVEEENNSELTATASTEAKIIPNTGGEKRPE